MTDTSQITASLDLGAEYVSAAKKRVAIAIAKVTSCASALADCTPATVSELTFALTDATVELAHEASALLPPSPQHLLRAAVVMSRAESRFIKVMIPVRQSELRDHIHSTLSDLQRCTVQSDSNEILVSGAGWTIVAVAMDMTNGSGDGLSSSEGEAP